MALAAAWMLTQALALDVEVVPFEVVPVGKWPAYSRGPAVGLAVQSDRAYVAAGEGGLIIIDIRDPANPQRVGGYYTEPLYYAAAVAVAGNYAYLMEGGVMMLASCLEVIDIRDPAHPHRVAGCDTSGGADVNSRRRQPADGR